MFSFASKTNDPNARLGWNERIGYGIGNFGMATVNGLMSGFFMKYLTDVSLFDAAAISTIIAVSKLFDGFSDIVMGNAAISAAQKLGLGLGQVALGIILDAGGYVGGAETQTESAKAAISFMYNWLPVIVIAIATFVMFFYRLDKQLPQIHNDLEERRKHDSE